MAFFFFCSSFQVALMEFSSLSLMSVLSILHPPRVLCNSPTPSTKVWRSSRYRNAPRYQNPRHIPREPSIYCISMDTIVIIEITMHSYSYTGYNLLHSERMQHWSSTCCDSYGSRSEVRLIVWLRRIRQGHPVAVGITLAMPISLFQINKTCAISDSI